MICLIIRAAAVWMLLLFAAVVNGVFRQLVLEPWLGTQVAHALSTAILCSLIFGLGWLTLAWIDVVFHWEAWTVGCIWLGLTLGFEFLGGHYLFGSTWSDLFTDYNVWNGRIWILILLTTAFTPLFVLRWKL